MYKINEIFTSIQGEGHHAGAWVNFVRFAGCNLRCEFCDTDHSCKMELEGREILDRLDHRTKTVVLTGGEPTLQVDQELCQLLEDAGFRIHLETNGSREINFSTSWNTVSPKLVHKRAHIVPGPYDEAKWLIPMWSPKTIFGNIAHQHFLQPIDGPDAEKNLNLCLEYMKEAPWLRLSVQLHKLLGLR